LTWQVAYAPEVAGQGKEEMDASEVTQGAVEAILGAEGDKCMCEDVNLSIRNVYFECVPLSLTVAVVTERGALADVGQMAVDRRRRFETAFFK
jgi:translation initiation factor 2B subunit (eIF-2B alpha/beta/delta family)